MKFNAKTDLDPRELLMRASTEAKLIYKKPSTRKGRTLQQITEACLRGHAAELYLIKYQNFSDDLREYKDLFDPSEESTEIKVTEGEYYVPYVLNRCNQAAAEKWRKYPKKLMIFIDDSKTNDYYLYNTYEYINFEFREISSVQTLESVV